MAIAITGASRLQDLTDVNVTLAAGVDEYVLTYDHDTQRFLLRASAAGVTDHGLLDAASLLDDDHTQYLLATGSRTGASAAAQPFTHGIIGPSWKPSADSVTSMQLQNTGGGRILNVDTTNNRIGILSSSPKFPLDVSGGVGIGLSQTEARNVSGGGPRAFSMIDPVAVVRVWRYGVVTSPAVIELATGTNDDISNSANVWWDFYAYKPAAGERMTFRRRTGGASQEWFNILASGYVGLGTNAPSTVIHAVTTDATTNAIVNMLTLTKDVTSGIGAAGLGPAIVFQAESSTTTGVQQARIGALWNDATHATYKADLVGYASDSGGEREIWRGRGNGSAAAIGFLGAAPAARIAHVADASTTHAITDPGDAPADADALREDLVTNVIPSIESALNALGTTINSLLTTVETFGLHATS